VTPREFIEWFRDDQKIDGMRVAGIMTPEGMIDLDDITDEEAEAIAEKIMFCYSTRGNA
jgi:hypothetical protein